MKMVRFTKTFFMRFAAVSGFAAVALGAYGAHGFKPEKQTSKEIFQTANYYHHIHNVALLAAMPMVKKPALVGGLFVTGITLFCGSCYVAALKEDMRYGRLAPIGGTSFMLGWLAMLL